MQFPTRPHCPISHAPMTKEHLIEVFFDGCYELGYYPKSLPSHFSAIRNGSEKKTVFFPQTRFFLLYWSVYPQNDRQKRSFFWFLWPHPCLHLPSNKSMIDNHPTTLKVEFLVYFGDKNIERNSEKNLSSLYFEFFYLVIFYLTKSFLTYFIKKFEKDLVKWYSLIKLIILY